MLSDGADNAGGIDLATIAAIRRQRIPVHTIGFGKEHPDKDVEITDAVMPARALPDSKLTATVTLAKLRTLRQQEQAHACATSGKVLASQDVVFKDDGQLQTETLVFNGGDGGTQDRSTFRSTRWAAKRISSTTRHPHGQRRSAQAAHPLYAGRAALGVQVHPARHRRLPRYRHRTAEHAAHHAEQDSTARAIKNAKELEDGFPSKPEDLFAYPGLIIGSVEANYFTARQQQVIHDFVDRRGGGLLFIGGRASLSDGG